MRSIIYILLAVVLFACAEDQGNYTYKKLRSIRLKNILVNAEQADDYENEELAYYYGDPIYKVLQNTNMYMRPVIEIVESNGDTTVLNADNAADYVETYWIVDGDTISSDFILNERVVERGEKIASRLLIKDKKTGVLQSKLFYTTVTGVFGTGLFILSKDIDDNNKTYLSYKSTVFTDVDMITMTELDDISLGSDPVAIDYREFDYSTINLVCENAPYQYISFYANGLQVAKTTGENGFIDGVQRPFNPTYWIPYRDNEHFISNGKLLKARSAVFYPIVDNNDYYLDSWVGLPRGKFMSKGVVTCYDKLSGKFIQFYKTLPDPLNNVVGNANVYSNTEIVSSGDINTEGLKFVATGGAVVSGSDNSIVEIHLVMKDASNLRFFTLTYTNGDDPDAFPYVPTLTEHTSLPIEGEVSAVFNRNTLNWYVSFDNNIYECNTKGTINKNLYFTLPEESGYVTKLDFSRGGSKLYAGTYNPAATGEFKGGLYTINFEDKELREEYTFPNSVKYPVDIVKSL